MTSSRGERNGGRVRDILGAAGPMVELQRREARGMLREVLLADGRYVVKRYTCGGEPSRGRRPWVAEDRALRRLDGRHAPAPVGFLEERDGDEFRATLVRGYVSGTSVDRVDKSLIGPMARSIAAIHGQGVITEDAHRENFVRDGDGELSFVDFGKARTFAPWNPLLFAGIAFDLHRLYRAALDRDEWLWRSFLDAYFLQTPFRRWQQSVVRTLLAVERRRYRMVKGG